MSAGLEATVGEMEGVETEGTEGAVSLEARGGEEPIEEMRSGGELVLLVGDEDAARALNWS